MKIPKDITTLAFLFLILFVLIKGFSVGDFLGNIF